MKKKVILTRKYQDEGIRQLRESFNLIIVEDSGKTLPGLLQENPDTEALISFLSDKIDKPVIDLVPNLKIIANYAVGYNNIDVQYAIKKGIMVTHTPDVLTNATADLTMALILATCRRLVEGDELLRQGKFKGWGANFLLGKELNGSTLGIIGMGRIGQATALRAKGFGLTITYFNRTRKFELEKDHGFIFKPLHDLVKESDIVSLHIPASPGVYHLFNKNLFDLMKKDAVFINVSRGDLVDEAYLAEKLAKNELFAAGLDVYEYEPHINEQLLKLKNVVLAPHIGSATYKARMGMAQLTIDNVKQVLSGNSPQTPVPECRSILE
ncbi:MAG: D-glycerate dehydrogenase, partial [Acidobacteria bacterium]|nr:D-glycerate dehydrogenase [Acidobacteriota bacterium]